jgi:hypothetical protein
MSTLKALRLCSRALTIWMSLPSARSARLCACRREGGRDNARALLHRVGLRPWSRAYSRSARPVCDCVRCSRRSSGVPTATTCPPASPPSGPRSMSQSLARITSRLCSITTSEWPASSSLRSARMSLAMSSKCRPVVGSSKRKSVPLLGQHLATAAGTLGGIGQKAGELEALRFAARKGRDGLPQAHVLEPHIHDGLQHGSRRGRGRRRRLPR